MPPSMQVHNTTTPLSNSKQQHRRQVSRKAPIEDDNQSNSSSSTSTTATNTTSGAPKKRVQQQRLPPGPQRPNLMRPKSMPVLNQNAIRRSNSIEDLKKRQTKKKAPKQRRNSIQVGHLSRTPEALRPGAGTLKKKSLSANDLSKIASKSSDLPASIHKAFPTAIPIKEMVGHVTATLAHHGYGSSTLLSTSVCCDEVNRDLEHEFEEHFGNHFAMGGLAGFPFGGATSFKAMAHHIPDGGSCLLVYGPHVGIDRSGKFGTVERRGRLKSGSCCGSAKLAANYCCAVHEGTQEPACTLIGADIDIEQHFVGQMLLPHAKRLYEADWPEVELPRILYEEQQKQIYEIVQHCCNEVEGNGKIALLGGIQINTPCEQEDYFVPLDFELRTNQDGTILNKFDEAFSEEAEIMA